MALLVPVYILQQQAGQSTDFPERLLSTPVVRSAIMDSTTEAPLLLSHPDVQKIKRKFDTAVRKLIGYEEKLLHLATNNGHSFLPTKTRHGIICPDCNQEVVHACPPPSGPTTPSNGGSPTHEHLSGNHAATSSLLDSSSSTLSSFPLTPISSGSSPLHSNSTALPHTFPSRSVTLPHNPVGLQFRLPSQDNNLLHPISVSTEPSNRRSARSTKSYPASVSESSPTSSPTKYLSSIGNRFGEHLTVHSVTDASSQVRQLPRTPRGSDILFRSHSSSAYLHSYSHAPSLHTHVLGPRDKGSGAHLAVKIASPAQTLLPTPRESGTFVIASHLSHSGTSDVPFVTITTPSSATPPNPPDYRFSNAESQWSERELETRGPTQDSEFEMYDVNQSFEDFVTAPSTTPIGENEPNSSQESGAPALPARVVGTAARMDTGEWSASPSLESFRNGTGGTRSPLLSPGTASGWPSQSSIERFELQVNPTYQNGKRSGKTVTMGARDDAANARQRRRRGGRNSGTIRSLTLPSPSSLSTPPIVRKAPFIEDSEGRRPRRPTSNDVQQQQPTSTFSWATEISDGPISPPPSPVHRRYRGWVSTLVAPLSEFIDEAVNPRDHYLDLVEIAEGESGTVYSARINRANARELKLGEVVRMQDFEDLGLDDDEEEENQDNVIDGEEKRVAIKSVALVPSGTPKLVDIQKELNLTKGLWHFHILTIDAVYIDLVEDCVWLRMEMMEKSLADLIALSDKGLMLEEKVIARFAGDILLALEFLLRNKIAHRDLRSDNVLINNQGVVKLADFSNAVQVNPSKPLYTDVVGIPYWQAPELKPRKNNQHQQQQPITTTAAGPGPGSSRRRRRTVTSPYDPLKLDVWSLGSTVWEMAETFPPFSDTNLFKDRWPPLSHPAIYSSAFHAFLMKCSEPAMWRPTAVELLKTPFISNAGSRTEIVQLLAVWLH